MKKSIKKQIEIGAIIKPKDCTHFYKVTELFERKFKCEMITDDEDWISWQQEFYYNIDMEVYNLVAANYS